MSSRKTDASEPTRDDGPAGTYEHLDTLVASQHSFPPFRFLFPPLTKARTKRAVDSVFANQRQDTLAKKDTITHKPGTPGSPFPDPARTELNEDAFNRGLGEHSALRHDEWKLRMRQTADAINKILTTQGTEGANDLPPASLEYMGLALKPTPSEMDVPMPMPWALPLKERVGLSGLDLLNAEIAGFAQHMQCTPYEEKARQAVQRQAFCLVRLQTPPNAYCYGFGSQKTGMAFPFSDLDYGIGSDDQSASGESVDQNPLGDNETQQQVMDVVTTALKDDSSYICVLSRARGIPTINAQHTASGIDIQIVLKDKPWLQRRMLRPIFEELPHLRVLYAVLRTMLGMRGLHDVFNGGLGSYSLIIMIAACLLRRGSPVNNSSATAGEQLLYFLSFYASFDMTRQALSVGGRRVFHKHPPGEFDVQSRIDSAKRRNAWARAAQWNMGVRRPLQPYLLCLQDPADIWNDLGRKTQAIKHIQRTIEFLHLKLRAGLAEVDAAAPAGAPWRGESLLAPLVGRCHEVYHERRRKIEEYGASLEDGGRRSWGQRQPSRTNWKTRPRRAWGEKGPATAGEAPTEHADPTGTEASSARERRWGRQMSS